MVRSENGMGLLRITGALCVVRGGASLSVAIGVSPTSRLDASGGSSSACPGGCIRARTLRQNSAVLSGGVFAMTV